MLIRSLKENNMNKIIQKLLILSLSTTSLLLAGGKIVYQDNTKIVIGCDDNQTSLIIKKENDKYIYEGKSYPQIKEIIKKECR